MPDQDPQPPPSPDLIVYRLDELKTLIREGFERVHGRLDGLEGRVDELEAWRDHREGQDDGPRVPRIVAAAVTLAAALAAGYGGTHLPG